MIATSKDETVLMHTATRASWSGGTEVLGMLLERTSDASEKEKALFAVLREGGSIVIRGVSENANSEAAANETGKPQSEPPDTPAVRTVRLLLDKGVPIESRDEEGSTLLTTAAGYGETEIVRLLLERGADVQAKDEHGLTALMAAACQCALATMNDTYDIVKILLEKGADVNGRNHEGETALILASGMAGDPAVLKLLLDGGADPTAKDKHGETALALAIKSYRPDKVQVLKQATAHAR